MGNRQHNSIGGRKVLPFTERFAVVFMRVSGLGVGVVNGDVLAELSQAVVFSTTLSVNGFTFQHLSAQATRPPRHFQATGRKALIRRAALSRLTMKKELLRSQKRYSYPQRLGFRSARARGQY